jgi:TonB family protein
MKALTHALSIAALAAACVAAPAVRVMAQTSPQPAASACATPDRAASVTHAVIPDYPDSARPLNLGPTTVLLQVTVGSDGELRSATIYKSSNNMAMDQAALRAARKSTYQGAITNCAPAGGIVLFHAPFDPAAT